jgi:hypothetical protein
MVLDKIWDRLSIRIVGVIFLIPLIALFVPLRLPIAYSVYTTDLFDLVEGMEPGDVVVFGNMINNLQVIYNARDMYGALVQHMFDQDIVMVFASFETAGIAAMQYIIDRYNLVEKYDLVYGVDYVLTPYIAGREAAVARFAEDMQNGADKDGTPMSQIPLLRDNNIRSMADVDYALATIDLSTDMEIFVRQWPGAYANVQFIAIAPYTSVAYTYGDLVQACVQYAFEYEHITGYFGEEIMKKEAYSVAVILLYILVFLGVFVNWSEALRGRQAAQADNTIRSDT